MESWVITKEFISIFTLRSAICIARLRWTLKKFSTYLRIRPRAFCSSTSSGSHLTLLACKHTNELLGKGLVVLLLANMVNGAPGKTKSSKMTRVPTRQGQKQSRQVTSKRAQKQPTQRSPKNSKKGTGQLTSKKVAAPGQEALYVRLGGDQAIAAVVDQFAANCAGDSRVASFFKSTVADAARFSVFKKNLADQICALSGGPCRYSGKEMRSAHLGMRVRNEHFDALVENFTAALDQFKVRSTEKTELIKILSAMRSEIVEKQG